MLMDSGSREWQLLSWLFLSNQSTLAVGAGTCWERLSQPSAG